jgi:hypothetical protein
MRTIPLIAFILTGCAGHAVPPAATVGNAYLVCGSAVRLDISHDGRSAIVREDDGSEMVLQRAGSPFGTKYQGAGISIIRSADTYLYLDRSGASVACAPLPR